MTNVNKVLRGLEKCIPGDCDVCPYNYQEGSFRLGEPSDCHIQDLLKDAAALIRPLAEPASVMTLEEIQAAPEGSVLWEEVLLTWDDIDPETLEALGNPMTECDIAPVEKRGNKLCGTGIVSDIRPELLQPFHGDKTRYWSKRPTEEQRKETAWE